MFYDLLTPLGVGADLDQISAVNLACDHLDVHLVLVNNHELTWEVGSHEGVLALLRAARTQELHLYKRIDSPVLVTQP